jgi:hypothetical protein
MSETEIFASQTVPSRRWVKDPDSLSLPSSGAAGIGDGGDLWRGRAGVRDEGASERSVVVSCR